MLVIQVNLTNGQHQKSCLMNLMKNLDSHETLVLLAIIICAINTTPFTKMDLNKVGGVREYFAIHHIVRFQSGAKKHFTKVKIQTHL